MNIETLTTRLFHFNRYISSLDAISTIRASDPQNPWEPANIEILFLYGANNPDEQRKYPIVGLGSVAEVRGNRRVPCLDGQVPLRSLVLDWWDGDWGGHCRFLAVRKPPSAT
jgi:hypothetical protein